MPRPRKPTAVLERSGAFLKNPKRKRKDPKTGAIGDPPGYFTDAQKLCWREIVSCAPEGVLNSAGRHAVEAAAFWLSAFRDRSEWTTQKDQRLGWWLTRLGMTPADLSKVNGAEPEKPEDPAAKYLN